MSEDTTIERVVSTPISDAYTVLDNAGKSIYSMMQDQHFAWWLTDRAIASLIDNNAKEEFNQAIRKYADVPRNCESKAFALAFIDWYKHYEGLTSPQPFYNTAGKANELATLMVEDEAVGMYLTLRAVSIISNNGKIEELAEDIEQIVKLDKITQFYDAWKDFARNKASASYVEKHDGEERDTKIIEKGISF